MELIGVLKGKSKEDFMLETENRLRATHPDWGEIQITRSKEATARGYESFKKYEVFADNVEDFINRYGKSKSYSERGNEYMQVCIRSHNEDLYEFGYTFITHHDSKCGDEVSYYGRKSAAD